MKATPYVPSQLLWACLTLSRSPAWSQLQAWFTPTPVQLTLVGDQHTPDAMTNSTGLFILVGNPKAFPSSTAGTTAVALVCLHGPYLLPVITLSWRHYFLFLWENRSNEERISTSTHDYAHLLICICAQVLRLTAITLTRPSVFQAVANSSTCASEPILPSPPQHNSCCSSLYFCPLSPC